MKKELHNYYPDSPEHDKVWFDIARSEGTIEHAIIERNPEANAAVGPVRVHIGLEHRPYLYMTGTIAETAMRFAAAGIPVEIKA